MLREIMSGALPPDDNSGWLKSTPQRWSGEERNYDLRPEGAGLRISAQETLKKNQPEI